MKQIKVAIFSCWNIASPFPKLFCAQLHVVDCTEKIWTDLALSLFCCRQCIWIPCLVLLVCAFLWWAPFKVRASSRSTCGPVLSPRVTFALYMAHYRSQALPSLVSTCWSYAGFEPPSKALSVVHRLHSPLCSHLRPCPTLPARAASSSARQGSHSAHQGGTCCSVEFGVPSVPTGNAWEKDVFQPLCTAWETRAQRNGLTSGQTGAQEVSLDLNPTRDSAAPGTSFCFTVPLAIWMPFSSPSALSL